ncbi:MAG: PHP domain-containing protein [Clostridia bacterium]|nr:PHP domain-containing protein [Clostridia bacterium]MBQ9505896.1 PHP domain-containing protein [Clostridia bacterium]
MSGDLHCHTRLTDGSMGIEDIIALAKNKGLETIAITDRDCQAGTVRAKIIGERNGIRVIPGVELSSVDGETSEVVCILCYMPEFADRLEGLCHRNAAATKRAAQKMMIKTAKRFPITADVIKRCASGSTNLYIPHIMHALMECGETDGIYSELYRELFTPESEANIIEIPAYAETAEVLTAIKDAGGISVLARPASSRDPEALLDRLVGLGLNGVEVWHPSADKERTDMLYAYAKKNKLLMVGGSDFRGMYTPQPLALGSYLTPKTQLAELLGYKSKLKRLAKREAALVEKEAAEAAAALSVER